MSISLQELEKQVSEYKYRFETNKCTIDEYYKTIKELELYLYTCTEEAKGN